MPKSRLNLPLLRALTSRFQVDRAASLWPGPQLTRRFFLTISGGGALYGTVSPLFRGDGFSVLRDGERIHLVVGEERRWTVDPDVFGNKARCDVEHGANEISISLKNGFFPATDLPADFVCILTKRAGIWMLHIAMGCGIEVSSPLLDWLDRRTVAEGLWKVRRFAAFDECSVTFGSFPAVRLTPEWIFSFASPSQVLLQGLDQRLSVSHFELHLNSAESISGIPTNRSTTLVLPRGSTEWAIDLSRRSGHGWAIDHDPSESVFDELRVESAHADGSVLRSALFLQSPANDNVLSFHPGGGLLSDSGEPFSLPLRNPRLAFSLDGELHSSLVADLHDEPIWAHDADASYLFASSAEAPHFELHEGPQAADAPQLSPAICEICFPNDTACVKLKMGIPRPVPFTWADLLAPFERFLGWLHLLPTYDGKQHKLIIDLQGNDVLSIERPDDLLSLQFKFDNMRLVTGFSPRIVHAKHLHNDKHATNVPPGSVSVIFPPQHVAERAFYHTTDSPIPSDIPVGNIELDDYNRGSSAPISLQDLKKRLDPAAANPNNETDVLPPDTIAADPTNLAFHFPDDKFEISCAINGLLDWTHWIPSVVAVAKSKPTLPAQIVPPGTFETNIQLPYRLSLSPSDLGRWAHALNPVKAPQGNAIELWHTRLGVQPRPASIKKDTPPNPVDETNSQDRTARAVYSPDFTDVPNPSCTPGPDQFKAHFPNDGSPFRMSLDGRDRLELVHLTSNYTLTQQTAFCPTPTSTLPGAVLQPPTPVQINRMMLTAMGGYLEAFGQWNPVKVDGTHQLTVQLWEHIATLGRDHYVKVLYKGYLAPFGLRASLVKVTQRYFEPLGANGWVAILHQHMYIVVKNERKQCPILGQPYGGRAFPFSYVEPVTLRTPFLSIITKPFPQDQLINQDQTLFWPRVPSDADPKKDTIFNFRLRFTDITGAHSCESSMPLLFVASDVAQGDNSGMPVPTTKGAFVSQDAVYFYNRGSAPNASQPDPYRSASFAGTKLSFAPSTKPGDTDFETATLAWRATPLAATIILTVKANNGNPWIASNPGAYVTITSAATGTSIVQPLSEAAPYTLTIDSGSIVVTITTPVAGKPTSTLNTAPLATSANIRYKLDLVLTDATHFSGTPTLAVLSGTVSGTGPMDLYHQDLPYFYPAVDFAMITSTSIKRITGQSAPTKFTFYTGYLTDGFNTSSNPGEVMLQKHPDDKLPLQFGGANGNVDKAGGLASPDALVVGFSRKAGPVGGKTASATATAQTKAGGAATPASNNVITSVSTFSSGKFDPVDFFGGLLSAKLLGAVNLSDIIAPLSSGLSNLAQAPQMVEQALYSAQGALDTAKGYIQLCVAAIDDFQTKQVLQPLAIRLATQAKAVDDANDDLNAAGTNVIAEAIAEAQVVARIANYTAALQGALQNPLSLVEDAVLTALSSATQTALTQVQTQAQAEVTAVSAALGKTLDDAVQTLMQGLTPLATAMANAAADEITAADQKAKTLNQPIQNAISYLAPDLNNIVQLTKLIPLLKGDISTLGPSISAAVQNPSLLPQVLVNASNILDDLQLIYQNAGFLGVVVNAPTLAAFDAGRTNLLTLWHYADYVADASSQLTKDLAAFHDNCLKLASASQQTPAQQILQSLNQFETAIQKSVAYKARIADQTKPLKVTPSDINSFRELQLLQKMQGQMLSALAALQNQALASPSASVAQAINSAALSVAKQMTVVSKFWDSTDPLYSANRIELLLAGLTSDPQVTQPLNVSVSETLQQIVALRARIVANPQDLGLQLLLYNLNIDYQRPLAAALAYVAYFQEATDDKTKQLCKNLTAYLPPILNLIATVANTLQAFFCKLSSIWTTFRKVTLANLQGPLQTPIGPIIDSLFGSDLDAIGAAFDTLCTSKQTTPSEYLRNCRTLIAAFVTLEKDVRAKITSLPAIEAALLGAIQQEINDLLATLLANIPVPTNINLSYTWNPTIQSCAPVFLLNPDANFSVTVSAQAGLDPSLTLTAAVDITASLTNFSIALIGDDPFVTLVIDSVTFTSHNGSKPDVRLLLNTVVFGASMQFVQDLADLLDPTDGPFIELAQDSIRAGFRFAIESMTLGAFNLMQLAIEVAVALPFDGTPVRCEMGLSDQQLPFLLSCGIYGGGGFLQLQLGLDGVQLLQGAFEFGVCADISIGPIAGSGFVVAGIYFSVSADSSEVCGFVHAHGHMDIFGIITLDIDLYVSICYQNGSVTGLATFSVSVSIAFFSETFTMQAQYTFAGSDSPNNSNDALLEMGEMRDPSAEAFLVSPQPDDDFAYAFVASIPAPPAKKAKPPSRPEHKTIPPAAYQQEDGLVSQTTWESYFNSFVKG